MIFGAARQTKRALVCFAFAGACLAFAGAARASDELRLIFPSALAPALEDLLPAYEKGSGNKLVVDHGGLGVIAERVAKGEAFDVVVTSREQIEAMRRKNQVGPGDERVIAKGGIGVGTRKGYAKPEIATKESFVAAMKSVSSLAYVDPSTGSAVGAYLTGLFDRLGLSDQLKAKTVLARSARDLFGAVASGKADIALAQMSEIVADPALDLAGPLPAEIQSQTQFAAGVVATGAHPAAARGLIDYLSTPAAAAVFKDKGLSP
jgi:molybdate transport system substrate-binding protein